MTRRAELLVALAATPDDLGRLVRGRVSAAFSHRSTVEGWTGLDVLSHLVWVETQSLARIQQVVMQDSPPIWAIEAHKTAGDAAADPSALLAQFCQHRQVTIHYLEQLTPGQWQRTGQHPTRGRVSVRFLVDYLVAHDTEHLNQLLQLIN